MNENRLFVDSKKAIHQIRENEMNDYVSNYKFHLVIVKMTGLPSIFNVVVVC